ncbi:MAG: ABC transporter permease [Thermomicrobiales bacterium]
MKPLLYMIWANYRMTLRNRMALFWNLAFPMIFIVLFGFLFSTDFEVDIGIAGVDTNETSQEIASQIESISAFKVTTGSRDGELNALEDGNRSVVIVFDKAAEQGQVAAQVYYDESNPQQSQIALSAVQQFLDQINLQALDGPRPVTVTTEAVSTNDLRYIDFLVPGILAMSIMNSGLIGLASAFVTYREKGILRRIKATPFPLSQFIVARIVSQLTIALLQATVLIGLGKLLFDLRIDGNLFNVFVMVIIGAVAFLSLGFVISSFAKNQEAADALANAFAFPMLFLAGVFFPVDSAPAWLQPITRAMPLRYLADAMRDLMVRGGSLPDEWFNILIMLITAAVGLLLSMRLFKWEASTA